jgi:hypothetical protein
MFVSVTSAFASPIPPWRTHAPFAPSVGDGQLVLWIGDHHGKLLQKLDRAVVGTIAAPLSYRFRNTTALRRARRELGLGVMYELEAWRLQLPVGHRLRGEAWRDLGMDTGKVYLPDRIRLTTDAATRHADRALSAQVPADPTIFTTPGHHLPDSQIGQGRANELLVIEAACERFQQRRLRNPAPDDPLRRVRQLYASVLVDASRLEDGDVAPLVGAYAGLGVDGFVVWAVNFNKGLRQAALLLDLTLGLERRSGKPVVGGGLSHWHLGALAFGLAATCTGPQRRDLLLPPADPPAPAPGEEAKGRAIHTYHGAVLGCFALDEAGRAKRDRAFMRAPCDCGHHPRREAPAREKIDDHNCVWLMSDARDMLRGSRAEAVSRLSGRAVDARATREAIGMTRLNACWSALDDDSRQAAGGLALPGA